MSDTTDSHDPATSPTVDSAASGTSDPNQQPKKKFTIIKQVNMIARTAIDDCINRLGPDVVTMSSEDIADQVVNSINVAIARENTRAKMPMLRCVTHLSLSSISPMSLSLCADCM